MPGNRPNSMLVAESLTPFTLGALISLYEHSTFVQGMIWDLNPYDQWGVQLGKVVADSIAPMLTGEAERVAGLLDERADRPVPGGAGSLTRASGSRGRRPATGSLAGQDHEALADPMRAGPTGRGDGRAGSAEQAKVGRSARETIGRPRDWGMDD